MYSEVTIERTPGSQGAYPCLYAATATLLTCNDDLSGRLLENGRGLPPPGEHRPAIMAESRVEASVLFEPTNEPTIPGLPHEDEPTTTGGRDGVDGSDCVWFGVRKCWERDGLYSISTEAGVWGAVSVKSVDDYERTRRKSRTNGHDSRSVVQGGRSDRRRPIDKPRRSKLDPATAIAFRVGYSWGCGEARWVTYSH